jgi:DNA-binding SARP family transcriptional activator
LVLDLALIGKENSLVRLDLLGCFSLSMAGHRLDVPHAAAQVIAYVALQDHGPEPRERVASRLWPDRSRARGLANLRSVLWRLPPPGRPVFDMDDEQMRLSPRVQLDIRRLSTGPDAGLAAHEIAAPLLPGWYEDWVLAERARVEQAQIVSLERLATRELEAGRFGPAIEAALLAVEREPLRERPHQLVLRAHLAEGNVGEALVHYRALRILLRDELGIEPSPATAALVAGHGAGPRRR